MLNERELSAAIGSTAYDADGDKIGTVEHFFADDRTGATTWVAVTTGLFGTKHSVVPASEATFADGALRLPVRKEAVRDAPRPSDPGRLDPATEAELQRHYGLSPAGTPTDIPPAAPSGLPPGARPAVPEETTGRHGAVQGAAEPPGPVAVPEHEVADAHGSDEHAATEHATDEHVTDEHAAAAATDGGLVRSEEQLRVGTERVVSGRVRLVKYVVTEEVQVTVPIRREQVRLEEVPAGSEDVPVGTGESLLPPGAEHGPAPDPGFPEEIVLHTERPVVTVEVVPVERVRVRTETVTGQEQVTERLQREQIVVDES